MNRLRGMAYGNNDQNSSYTPTNPGDPYNYWDHFPKLGGGVNKPNITPVLSLPKRGTYPPMNQATREWQQPPRNLDFQPTAGVSVSNRYEGLLHDIDY